MNETFVLITGFIAIWSSIAIIYYKLGRIEQKIEEFNGFAKDLKRIYVEVFGKR